MDKLLVFLYSILLALLISAIALLSVQNATPVSVRMLNWYSIELPVGLVLVLGMGGGIIAGSLLQWIGINGERKL